MLIGIIIQVSCHAEIISDVHLFIDIAAQRSRSFDIIREKKYLFISHSHLIKTHKMHN